MTRAVFVFLVSLLALPAVAAGPVASIPADSRGPLDRGLEAYEDGDVRGAIESLRRALVYEDALSHPRRVELHRVLGLSLAAAGEEADAHAHFKTAFLLGATLQRDPDETWPETLETWTEARADAESTWASHAVAVPVPDFVAAGDDPWRGDALSVRLSVGALAAPDGIVTISGLQVRVRPAHGETSVVAGVEAYRVQRTTVQEGPDATVRERHRIDVLPFSVGVRHAVPVTRGSGLVFGGGMSLLTANGIRHTLREDHSVAAPRRSHDRALVGYGLIGARFRLGSGALELDGTYRTAMRSDAGAVPTDGMSLTLGYAFSF